MWDLIVSVPDHGLSFYFQYRVRYRHIPFDYLASKGLLFKNLFIITAAIDKCCVVTLKVFSYFNVVRILIISSRLESVFQ